MEEWRAIPDLDGWYEVSNLGRIRSWVNGNRRWGRRDEPKILRPSTGSGGYQTVHLSGKTHRVHVLVASAFLNRPEGEWMQVCHNDGNPANNALSNLRWDTPEGNSADRIPHGTARGPGDCPWQWGEGNGRAKLTEDDVRKIRHLWAAGLSQSEIARTCGYGRRNVCQIVNRRAWAHVE